MKRFLFVVDRFYPDTSANTICCDNILKQFVKSGHIVDVLTLKKSLSDSDVEEYMGGKVYKFETYHFYWAKKFKKNDWLEINAFTRKSIGLWNKFKSFFNPLALNGYLDTVNVKKIYEMIAKENLGQYDGLLSFTEPFALQPICKKLMQKGIAKKWCTYMLDSFEFNAFHKKVKKAKRIKIANDVFSYNHKIFAVDGVMDKNEGYGYVPTYLDKVVKTHQPMLIDFTTQRENNEKINLVYTGAFYEDIRPPKEMLKILSNLSKDYEINLYGSGCEQQIEESKKFFKNAKLIVNGKVSREESLNVAQNSNILINLGNRNTTQIPSKILEYVGVGKPILNFYFEESDLGLEILKKYPLAFNFNLNDYTQKDVQNLIDFCNNNAHKQLTYEEATINLQEFKIENLAQLVLNEF